VEFWTTLKSELSGLGMPVTFLPMVQGWTDYAEDFAPISRGIAQWGNYNPLSMLDRSGAFQINVQTAFPQDVRPKNQTYREYQAAHRFVSRLDDIRDSGDVDWLMVGTWNDHSEGTAVQPSDRAGTVYMDVLAHKIAEFKAGEAIVPSTDALYAFQKPMTVGDCPWTRLGSEIEEDCFGVVAMLTEPATLTVTTPLDTYEEEIAAGFYEDRFASGIGDSFAVLSREGVPFLTTPTLTMTATNPARPDPLPMAVSA
jgi:hypothetical protein